VSQGTSKDSKTQILAAFRQLLTASAQIESKVATKEEEAEKEKNKQLLEVASTYTVDSIVNGMASLQLDFGSIIADLSQRLSAESSKLEELKRAIAVETENLEQLRKIRLVADALYILRQEHQEKMQALTDDTTRQQEAIEKDMTQTRKAWEKEQAEFETKVAEETELLTKQREQEAADYQYEIERERKIEMDEYEEEKRLQERTLQETNQEKEKVWVEREKFLADNREEFEANQKKIEGFEEELKKAYIKAKEDAIKDADREAKIKSDLLEKEWESTQQGHELKITSLEAVIERQTAQIAELTAQLQAATNQAQQLAMRAFQPSSKSA
jgi:DNA repair exonuclease SbcCD ATPase subunit